MPVYEYECKTCKKVIEIQQKIADAPLTHCPDCDGLISKIMSMSSFQLKGGGWYADGYSSVKSAAEKPASCKATPGCAGCPAAGTP